MSSGRELRFVDPRRFGRLSVAQAGDFDAFYRAHYRPVAGLAYVLTGDMGRAEDLAQDAFAAAHQEIGGVVAVETLAGTATACWRSCDRCGVCASAATSAGSTSESTAATDKRHIVEH